MLLSGWINLSKTRLSVTKCALLAPIGREGGQPNNFCNADLESVVNSLSEFITRSPVVKYYEVYTTKDKLSSELLYLLGRDGEQPV